MIGRMRDLLRRDAFHAALSTSVRSAGRLVATMLLARFAGMEAFAAITLSLAIEAIFISALNAVFVAPAAIIAPGRREALRRTIHAAAERSQTVAAGVCVVVGFGVALSGALTPEVVVPFACALGASAILQARRSTRIAEFRSGPLVWVESGLALVGVASAWAGAKFPDEAYALYWSGQAVAQAAMLLCLPGVRQGPSGMWCRRVVNAAMWRTGLKVLAGSTAMNLSGRSQPLLLSAILGPGAVAAWGAIGVLGAPIRMASGILRGIALPRLAQRQRSCGRGVGTFGARWMLGSALCVPVVFLLLDAVSPVIVSLLLGARFVDSAWLGPIIGTQAILAAWASFVSAQLQVEGRSGWVSAARWLIAAISLPLLWLGADTGQMTGFAWAGLLIEGGGCVALALLLVRSRHAEARRGAMPKFAALA